MAKPLLSIPVVLAFAFLSARGEAGELVGPGPDTAGILTDRLSGRQVETWRALERVVFAQSGTGGPLHPTLRRLWEMVRTSGHRLHVEIRSPEEADLHTAGVFLVEKHDPEGKSHTAVIRLFPDVIDKASTSRHASRTDGFTPFIGLAKVERYAEALGHELQHAVSILLDVDQARLYQEWRRERADLLRCWEILRGGEDRRKEWEDRLTHLHRLEEQLERLPRKTETIVWKELIDAARAKE